MKFDLYKSPPSLNEWLVNKRQVIFSLFQQEEYGIRSIKCEQPLVYEVVKEKIDDSILIRYVDMLYDDLRMPIYIYLPHQQKGKLKTFVLAGLDGWSKKHDFYQDYRHFTFCPVATLIEQGFAVVLVDLNKIAKDEIGGETSGVFKAMKVKRTKDSFGVLSAWAYGLSKAADYLATQEQFDMDNLAVIGHSRGGKTALLAGAYDHRFKLVISNNSGCSGAAISRNSKGETIKDITKRFPYWFCENYFKYADNEEKLPFDQHQLLALIAPRCVYIASASEDLWADPNNELLGAKLASPYFEIHNVKGLIIEQQLQLNKPYIEGQVCYHRRVGKHALINQDWEYFVLKFNAM